MVTIRPEDLDTVMLSYDEIGLTRLFVSQTMTLPKFKGNKGESWQAFESTFRLRWANSVLDSFPLDTQKGEILRKPGGTSHQSTYVAAKWIRGMEDEYVNERVPNESKGSVQPTRRICLIENIV